MKLIYTVEVEIVEPILLEERINAREWIARGIKSSLLRPLGTTRYFVRGARISWEPTTEEKDHEEKTP